MHRRSRRSLEEREATRFRPLAVAAATAVLGLVITALVTMSVVRQERDDAATETTSQLVAVGDAIDRQVSRYAETLFGLRSAFARDPALSRDDFRQLVDIDALTRRNPGAQSVTFNRFVPDSQLAAFVRETRREIPDFSVHPANPGRDHVIIDYIEQSTPESRAMGLDITAEPVRQAALSFARDSGELSASRPLALIQEPGAPGFLLMLAAYDESPVPVTAPARSRHFLGVLVAVFEADAMIEHSTGTTADLDVAIYDAGPTVDTPHAEPGPEDWLVGRADRYSSFTDIDVGSRRWRLVTNTPVEPSHESAVAIATTGTALTVIIGGVLAAISVGRRRALKLADRMTVDLRAADEQLRTANEALRGFVDVAAHDLRSPLTSIAGFSALLSDEQVELTAEERRKALTAIDRQSQHMGRLIDDLLTLSSIDGDGLVTRPEPVVLATAIRECIEATAGYASLVTVDCAPDLAAYVDPHHLRRILDNYLHNATKYGAPPIFVNATLDGSTVEIRVLDQGPGVPAEFAPHLFDKFSRARGTTQTGTGLGLSIVRGLAIANGGHVSYEPNTPRGSCFIVELPAADRDATTD